MSSARIPPPSPKTSTNVAFRNTEESKSKASPLNNLPITMDSLMKQAGLKDTLNIIESMVQTKGARTSAQLGERCPIHGCGLNFYSSKEQTFKCQECLINCKDVQYIDKSYIASLERFNQIKETTENAIRDCNGSISDISTWKDDIRDMVMRVRAQFLGFIDEFTLQLKQNLINIDQHPKLKEYVGEDRRQEYRIATLEEKHKEIDRIIQEIEKTPRHQKAAAVRARNQEMTVLETDVTTLTAKIKEIRQNLARAQAETVTMESLSTTIFSDFLAFIQRKLQKINEQQSYIQKSKLRKANQLISELANESSQLEKLDNILLYSGHTTMAQFSKFLDKTKLYRQTLSEQDSNLFSGNLAETAVQNLAELTADLLTLRSAQMEEIYYLKPDAAEAWLLDFNVKKFRIYQLPQKIPIQSKSVQTFNGNIYVVGGMNSANKVLNDCFMITPKMLVEQQERMSIGRFGVVLALIHERFILALSGFTGSANQTDQCEAFDTMSNHWFTIKQMPFPVANTSAVVMNSQHVYVMPGVQGNKKQQLPYLCIATLDCGTPSSFRGDPTKQDYGYCLAKNNWKYLEVTNPEFVKSFPVGALQLNNNEMMIFGGDTCNTFIFNTNNVDQKTGRATISTSTGELDHKGRFGFRSDFVGKVINTVYYVVDASEQVIHLHEINSLEWISFPIAEFGFVTNK